MKNPLTSKERRGLAAVAAAALLCICSGFVFRSCSHSRINDKSINITESKDSLDSLDSYNNYHKKANGINGANKPNGDNETDKKKTSKRKGKGTKKKKALKSYPVRDPLSEPCD